VLLRHAGLDDEDIKSTLPIGQDEQQFRAERVLAIADELRNVDISPLDSPQAQSLMLLLAKYPDMLSNAASGFAPHDVAFYLRELAANYHSYYDAERILVDDEDVKLARLALVAATRQVLHNGLLVLGVSAPAKM
jgi:arginyl-tRNA synthetase